MFSLAKLEAFKALMNLNVKLLLLKTVIPRKKALNL